MTKKTKQKQKIAGRKKAEKSSTFDLVPGFMIFGGSLEKEEGSPSAGLKGQHCQVAILEHCM